MTEVGEQLLDDLMRLKPVDMTANSWAVRAGVSRTIWADIRRHGNPSRRTLEKLLAAAESSLAEFEALRIDPPASTDHHPASGQIGDVARPWRQQPLPPLPVVESRQGGEWPEIGSGLEVITIMPDRIIDRLPRPASLANDSAAFALTVIGNEMWPRFRPGRRVAVSPAAAVAIGDDVALDLGPDGQGGQKVLLKELGRRSAASIELRQFHPDRTFTVAADQVVALHKVVGELF